MNNNLVKVARTPSDEIKSPSQNYMTSFTKWHKYNERVLPLTAFPLIMRDTKLIHYKKRGEQGDYLKRYSTFIENEVTALDLSDHGQQVLQELVAFKYFNNLGSVKTNEQH
jgi:hypothetical protein